MQNKKSRFYYLLIISGLFFLLGMIPPSKIGIGIGMIFGIIWFLSIKKNNWQIKKNKFTISQIITFIIAEGLFFRFLYKNWMSAVSIQFLCDRLTINKNFFVLFMSLIITFGSSFVILMGIKTLTEKLINKEEKEVHNQLNWKLILYLLVIAVIGITLCSRTSPLYRFNDSFDSHIYFTIGRGMTEGKVLYRDLLDQKGPYIYFIHALASLIDNRTFFGIYLIQIVFFFITLIFGAKIIKIFIKEDRCIYFGMPIFIAIALSSFAYWYGNNSEEYCWPSLMFGIYVLVKSLNYDRLPTNKEYFWIGVTSGFVLWLKFTFLAFYIGWYCVPLILYIKNKEGRKFTESILSILGGVVVVSAPVIIYFFVNNALYDLWTSYFYNNLFVYKAVSLKEYRYGMIEQIFDSLWEQGNLNPKASFLLILSSIWLYFQVNKKTFFSLLIAFFALCAVVMGIGVTYLYYYSIFSVFMIFAVIPIYMIIDFMIGKKFIKEILILIGCIVLMFTQSRNTSFILRDKNSYPQIKFAETMAQSENPTLLNYNMLDAGFYTASGIVPNTKYFCRINMPIQEQFDVQNDIVDNGKVEFIVTKEFYEFPLYDLIEEGDHDNGEGNIHYYLYQLKKESF